MKTLDRRQFLSAGSVSLALPMLESLGAAPPQRTPQRLVCIGVYLGFHTPSWLPTTAGADFAMPSVLAPLERHRADISIFSGLDHRAANGHRHWHNYLTGTGAHSVSLDQQVANHIGDRTRFASLQLTCGQANSQMSFSEEGVPLPMLGRPSVLYNRLFASASNKAHMRYLLDSGGSALDHVRHEARALNSRLASHDRAKLDEYFTSLRYVEGQLQKQRAWLDKPSPKVDYTLPEFDPIAADLSLECEGIMYDLMALALQTDSTRVISLLAPGSGQVFTLDGQRLSAGYHGLSHHGGDAAKIVDFNRIGLAHLSRLAEFLDRLRATDLLDSTAVLYGSGMGNANTHDNSKLPILLAGGGFRHGQHHIVPREGGGERLLGDLFLTLLQGFGIGQDRFQKAHRNMNEYLV